MACFPGLTRAVMPDRPVSAQNSLFPAFYYFPGPSDDRFKQGSAVASMENRKLEKDRLFQASLLLSKKNYCIDVQKDLKI